MTRRGVMRATAVGIGASATVAVGVSHPRGFVGDSEAALPVVAAVIGGVVVTDWALREAGVRGAESPAEGLTASALEQDSYQTAKTRKSTNASTIVDNRNILDGVEHTAYTEGKIAAIEQLNNGATLDEVQTAADDAARAYFATVQENLISTFEEASREFNSVVSSLESHADTSPTSVFDVDAGDGNWSSAGFQTDGSGTKTLADGTERTYDATTITYDERSIDGGTNTNAGSFTLSIGADNNFHSGVMGVRASYDGNAFTYLDVVLWGTIWSDISTTLTNVTDGLTTWTSSVYESVQSGDIEISDLVTPRERAAMMADEEGTSQALADLIALNVPVDLEREVTITIEDTGATLSGTFGLTDSSDGPIESGTTYDPSTFTGNVYFTADMSLLEGNWTAIETSVDGGTITITSEPYESTAIEVTTTAGETVSVPAGDWTDNDDGTWSYDASGDLETAITEVDSARFVSTTTETQYETLNLDGQFTVNEITNTETSEDVSSTSFSNTEPQSDSNYITQEEWDQLEQQNQELIEKYEESQNDGSGGGGGGGFLPEDQNWGLIAAGAGAAAVGWGYLTGGGE